MLFIINLSSEDRQLLLIFLLGIPDFLCMILSKVTDLFIEVVILKLPLLFIFDQLINLFSIFSLPCVIGDLFLLMVLEHCVEPGNNVLIGILPIQT